MPTSIRAIALSTAILLSGGLYAAEQGEAPAAAPSAAPATAPAEASAAAKPAPLAEVPALFGFQPYVTTVDEVQARFGGDAKLYEEGRTGRRHIVTGHDFGIGAEIALIYYTEQGTVSDLYLRVPAKDRDGVIESLKKETAAMDAKGVWNRSQGRDLWRTPTAELLAGAPREGSFSVEYGAAARRALETRAWIDEDPEHHAPHFAGLDIGHSAIADLKKVTDAKGDACRLAPPAKQDDGTLTYALTGECFGLPGEYQSYVWTGADGGRIYRLFIQCRGDPEGFSSVLAALKKRYKPQEHAGDFRVADARAKNIWPPEIRYREQEGTLEFYAAVDGVKRAEADYERLVEERKAREAQAKRVDALFE
jgi:hypothetical protein